MKTIILAILAVVLVGCSKSDETVSIGSKENYDKGMAVINQYHKALQESDRKLFEAEEKSKKASSAPPSK
ncbi:hypothetical protein H3H37_20630 [Duganella sp. LX20W]|uniref:Lipoprotein n=1 Tax=Rugamonas brunnea TaxID=2758569 RepID=A0A7W2EVP0_9BURK|nr:hypothetical protein [Rugamonas brunnea]MBA5639473.1 hypothetical protein [Rugamonas brunnea]